MKSLSKDHSELSQIWEWSMIFVPEKTGKGGAVHEISNNGVVSLNDPKDATKEIGEKYVNEIIQKAIALIEAWKVVK
jgi:creatinine amidohydrolase/Fe(II)-dependent formamide hydrolase-like protein